MRLPWKSVPLAGMCRLCIVKRYTKRINLLADDYTGYGFAGLPISKMNILFLDDDLKRQHAFQALMTRAQTQQKRGGLLGIFRRAPKTQDAEPTRIETAFTVAEAVQLLRDSERFDVAFLDHDLDGRTFVEEREGTGTEVAEYIAASMQADKRPRRIIVHSHNPAGARRMAEVLRDCGCEVEEWQFGSGEFARSLQNL